MSSISNSNVNYFNRLPYELVGEIFSLLKPSELGVLEVCCKFFSNMAKNEQVLGASMSRLTHTCVSPLTKEQMLMRFSSTISTVQTHFPDATRTQVMPKPRLDAQYVLELDRVVNALVSAHSEDSMSNMACVKKLFEDKTASVICEEILQTLFARLENETTVVDSKSQIFFIALNLKWPFNYIQDLIEKYHININVEIRPYMGARVGIVALCLHSNIGAPKEIIELLLKNGGEFGENPFDNLLSHEKLSQEMVELLSAHEIVVPEENKRTN